MRIGLLLLCLLTSVSVYSASIEDLEITNTLVYQSSSQYLKSVGKCPCPYSWNETGQPCGSQSQWWQSGGKYPVCYPSDISQEMISDYKEENGIMSEENSDY